MQKILNLNAFPISYLKCGLYSPQMSAIRGNYHRLEEVRRIHIQPSTWGFNGRLVKGTVEAVECTRCCKTKLCGGTPTQTSKLSSLQDIEIVTNTFFLSNGTLSDRSFYAGHITNIMLQDGVLKHCPLSSCRKIYTPHSNVGTHMHAELKQGYRTHAFDY